MSHYGLYPAIVTDLVDPDRLGRIEVKLPGLGETGQELRVWATLLSPYADADQGFLALPAVDTQVVIGFEVGRPDRAYLVGACWNGQEAMPVTPTRPNDKRVLRSRSGAVVEFDDTAGSAKVTVRSGGGHTVVLDDGGSSVRIQHANGFGITLTATGSVEVRANGPVDVTAPTMNVHAGTANFDGAITCTALTASIGVTAPLYSQGAGNVW
jgi:uncharacterized protein involved in type VI secretion and phage assembly